MKLKVLALALLVACVAVPAAGAKGKPPKHSGGPPSHASSGGPPAHSNAGGHSASHQSGSTQGQGSAPSSAHSGKPPKKDKGGRAGDRVADEPRESDEAGDGQNADEEGPNPAQTCRKRRNELGADAFALTYGTNANRANAFGKCVSSVARGDETASDAADKEGDEAETGEVGDEETGEEAADSGAGEPGGENSGESTSDSERDVDAEEDKADTEDGFLEEILTALLRLLGR